MIVFGPFFGPQLTISCEERSPWFDNFPIVSCVFMYLPTLFHHVFACSFFVSLLRFLHFFHLFLSSPVLSLLPCPSHIHAHSTADSTQYPQYTADRQRTHNQTHNTHALPNHFHKSSLCGGVSTEATSGINGANTRTLVHAWAGQSQGKLWRRLLAILTRKSFVTLGFWAERQN